MQSGRGGSGGTPFASTAASSFSICATIEGSAELP